MSLYFKPLGLADSLYSQKPGRSIYQIRNNRFLVDLKTGNKKLFLYFFYIFGHFNFTEAHSVIKVSKMLFQLSLLPIPTPLLVSLRQTKSIRTSCFTFL